jgi:hypothetical protein
MFQALVQKKIKQKNFVNFPTQFVNFPNQNAPNKKKLFIFSLFWFNYKKEKPNKLNRDLKKHPPALFWKFKKDLF